MSAKIQRQHAKSKRRIERRLDPTKFKDTSPVLSGSNIHYDDITFIFGIDAMPNRYEKLHAEWEHLAGAFRTL